MKTSSGQITNFIRGVMLPSASRRALRLALISSFLILCACQFGASNGPNRSTVMQDFGTDAVSATAHYRPLWKGANKISDDQQSNLALVAMATELMDHDPNGYAEYYDFLLKSLNSEDKLVRLAAIDGLSRARGRDSLDILLKMATDADQEVKREAVTSLNYRYATALYDPNMYSDKEYIASKLPSLCKNEFREEISQFCQ